MAGRLGTRSNSSVCRRVLDHARLSGASHCYQSESGLVSRHVILSDGSGDPLGPRTASTRQPRSRSVAGTLPSSSDHIRRSKCEPDGLTQDFRSERRIFGPSQLCIPRASDSTGSAGQFGRFCHWRDSGLGHRDEPPHMLASGVLRRALHGVSGMGETAVSTESETVVHHPASSDLHLPKLENATTELVNRVCAILDAQGWSPDAVKTLEDAKVVFSPFLIQMIVQRVSKDVDLTWNFFIWARQKAHCRLSLRAYIALVDALGKVGNIELMKKTFDLIHEDGHKKSAWPYNNALKWFSHDVDAALYFWGRMKEVKSRPTVITYTRLIDVLAKQGRLEAASDIFRQMLQDGCPPNITTYNVLIHAFGAAGQPEVAASLFDKLSELGCKPNYYTYNTLISMHVKAGKPDAALRYFNMLKATRVDIGDNVYKTLQMSLPNAMSGEDSFLEQFSECHTDGGARALSASEADFGFLDMTPGRLMSAASLVKMLEKGEHMSVEEKLQKIRPRIHPRFVVQTMQRIKNPDTALIFFDWAKNQPHFEHNEYSYSMIISILGRSRNSEAIERILKEMHEKGIKINTAIFTALITCYGRAKAIDGALQLFQQMKIWGCKPDTITYTSLIHLLAKHGSYEQAVEMFKEMQSVGCPANTHTYSVMIYNLVKVAKVTEAFELLKQMPELGCKPTPVTYATLMHYCAKEGHLEVAKDILALMDKEGVKPLKTAASVLDGALRKVGRFEEADALTKKLRQRRFWDETYKSSTEKVARELVFRNLVRHSGSEPKPIGN